MTQAEMHEKQSVASEQVTRAGVQVPTALVEEARKNSELGYLSVAALIRVAVALMAGYEKNEALQRFARRGTSSDIPKPV